MSFAEIGIKVAVGKLTVPNDLHESIRRAGTHTLGLSPEHGLGAAALPLHHRDPFDRLLIAQAIYERLTIVTSDPRFAEYAIPLVPVGFAA